MNKEIKRDGQTANKIFDNRSLENDYRTLVPVLKEGMKVLDVGCGTGAISKGIAERVGLSGAVIGIDNTEAFIISGKETYKAISNLELIHADLFQYETEEKFDLIVSARTLQWLSTPKEALAKMKSMLKPGWSSFNFGLQPRSSGMETGTTGKHAAVLCHFFKMARRRRDEQLYC